MLNLARKTGFPKILARARAKVARKLAATLAVEPQATQNPAVQAPVPETFAREEIVSQSHHYAGIAGSKLDVLTKPDLYGDFRPDQYYAAFGYYRAPGLFSQNEIDSLVGLYHSQLKTFSGPLARQNMQEETHKLNENGCLSNPLLNAHAYSLTHPSLRDFSRAVLNVATHPELHKALTAITLLPRHQLMQTMIFEQAVTPAHQDWVYLDTIPAGNLTAAWVALEDIQPDAARFFVVPGSQNFRHFFEQESVNSGAYLTEFTKIFKERYESKMVVPEMKRGDVLFWNSRLIHGSIPGTNPKRTRLSLAIHTIPKGFRYGNIYKEAIKSKPAGYNGKMAYF